jgi:hypothetical protein
MSPLSDLRAYLLRVSIRSTTTNNPASPPVALPSEPEPRKCRFRLDNDSSDTLTLPDGRKLGYAQYGSLTGQPIFYLHGLPGSRIEAAFSHDMGLKLGARIISMDRPGIGWSSPQPERTLLDHPKDLEHVAKHLQLDYYSILVRAVSYLIPEKILDSLLMVHVIGNIRRWSICTCLRDGITSRKA